MGGGSLIKTVATSKGAVGIAIISVIFLSSILLRQYAGVSLVGFVRKGISKFAYIVGKGVSKKEKQYHRDIEIGKLNNKARRVKIYRFMKDLIVDLNLDYTGITPYELVWFIATGSLILSWIVSSLFFTTTVIMILVYPICLGGVTCLMYTKANIAHENRIGAVIDSENIICNNISNGVLVAVKQNINIIPEETRPYFRDFIDNVEIKNYHIKTALLELNSQLGPMSDDFIKKCIAFELKEERGLGDMFQDVIEINNIKKDLRIEMKHELEAKVNEIRISTVLITVFLFVILAIYPMVRSLYFNTIGGNVLIVIDIFLLIVVYVITTIVRATEL